MSEQPDPERLIAEALRAKAVRAPLSRQDPPLAPANGPAPVATPAPAPTRPAAASPAAAESDAGPAPGTEVGRLDRFHDEPPEQLLRLLAGNEDEPDLLSGRASDTVAGMHAVAHPASAATGPATTMPGQSSQLRSRARPLSAWWIVLLAVLLGLAAGAIVGLVSLT